MAKICQIATVLYEVLKTVVPANQIDAQVWFCQYWYSSPNLIHYVCKVLKKVHSKSFSFVSIDSKNCRRCHKEKGPVCTF